MQYFQTDLKLKLIALFLGISAPIIFHFCLAPYSAFVADMFDKHQSAAIQTDLANKS